MINFSISTLTQGSKLPTAEKASRSSATENTTSTTDIEQRSFLLLDEKENIQVHLCSVRV